MTALRFLQLLQQAAFVEQTHSSKFWHTLQVLLRYAVEDIIDRIQTQAHEHRSVLVDCTWGSIGNNLLGKPRCNGMDLCSFPVHFAYNSCGGDVFVASTIAALASDVVLAMLVVFRGWWGDSFFVVSPVAFSTPVGAFFVRRRAAVAVECHC